MGLERKEDEASRFNSLWLALCQVCFRIPDLKAALRLGISLLSSSDDGVFLITEELIGKK